MMHGFYLCVCVCGEEGDEGGVERCRDLLLQSILALR